MLTGHDTAGLGLASPRVSLFLAETTDGLEEGAGFLARLTAAELARVRAAGRTLVIRRGASVFEQGTPQEGIFLIEDGRMRVFYTGPSGREITLAYWTPGNFVGGPGLFGGTHMWSGEAVSDGRLTVLSGATLQSLIAEMPSFALCLIDGLAAKGRCYSAMAQMLGTRSVIERLAQFLLNLAELYGEVEQSSVVIRRRITHDEIATMVGSTRQWVTMMFKRFQSQGIIAVDGQALRIRRPDLLEDIVFKDAA